MAAAGKPFLVNLGLHSTTTNTGSTIEGDLWYNSVEGAAKITTGPTAGDSLDVGIVGSHGTHPLLYDVANAWYPLTEAAGQWAGATTTNNRAYAYPFHPGRKCTMTDFAFFVDQVPGTGNLRMGLYDNDPATDLPGALIADYGTRTGLTATTVITGWTVGTVVQPRLHWIVLAVQTSVAPSTSTFEVRSGMIPEVGATPVMSTSASMDGYTSDTGFSGALPGTFGAVSNAAGGNPLLYVKLTI